MTTVHSGTREFTKAYGKVAAIVLMMITGSLLPQFHSLAFLIQYLLMAMLFFAFLDMEIKPGSFQKGVLWILLANVAVAFIGYWLLSYIDRTLALVAFITAIAPTAIASPVMISFIEGNVEYLAAAVLLTNLSMALIVPLALPFVVGPTGQISTWNVLQPVLLVMFAPLILTLLVKRLPQKFQTVIRKGKPVSFPLWLANLFIICAKAADFLHTDVKVSAAILGQIALVSLVVCVVNFGVGALIGGRQYWQESSQALGQKNNSFVIWIALTFISPLIAMGPTFYIIYHNLYNSFQIYLFESRRYNLSQKELPYIPTHIER
jgi:bile acid:Na+ symporter, BASS family